MRFLLTGAAGFIGNHLSAHLLTAGHEVRALVRGGGVSLNADLSDPRFQLITVGDFTQVQDWSRYLDGIDVVVHLAARVHVMHDESDDAQAQYDKSNVDITMALAQAALVMRVKKFIFLSSIKVNGERTRGEDFTASSAPMPLDPYGVSKYKAEQALAALFAQPHNGQSAELIIVRPPLVYGPGVGANFRRLYRLGLSRLPLPLKGFNNQRAMISVYNLIDFIRYCSESKRNLAGCYLVSDGVNYSLADLISAVRRVNKRRSGLFYFPPVIIRSLVQRLLGAQVSSRLFDELTLDICATESVTDWHPSFTLMETLEKMLIAEAQH
jgi:nucleoside-diphosphate-sugar epimerase